MLEFDTDLKAASLADLKGLLAINADLMAKVKAVTESINDEVRSRLGSSVKAAYDQQGKDHGTVRLPLQDGLTLKADVTKTVKYDGAQLLALAQTMPWADACRIFKIDVGLTETTYKGIAAVNPDLKAKIDVARTEKLGEPKLTLIAEGE